MCIYNVQGFYLSDPTNDCKSNGQTLNLSLITYNEHEKIYSSNETLYTDLRLLAGKYNKETTKYILDKQLTKPITVTQGKHALASVFRARNINKKQSLLYIQRSVYRALKNDHLLNGDNWISTLALALQSQRQSRHQMDIDPYSGLD